MRKDLFIDNNTTQYFSNPIDDGYKKLIEWLKTYSEKEEDDAYLVVSPFLIKEYNESNRYPNSRTNIVQIIADLTKEERLTHFSKKEIEAYQKEHFTKKVLKKLLTKETKDVNHIPIVLMSDRKMALTKDNNFTHDLELFDAIVGKHPDELAFED
jgi:hypothetical protein